MSFYQKDYNGEEVLVPSTILGYRQWTWLQGRLLSQRGFNDWGKGSSTAECYPTNSYSPGIHDSETAPELDCTCGLYAHYLPGESYNRISQVLGVVEASGKIIMGSKGFRAEKMKIVALTEVLDTDNWFSGTCNGYFTDYPVSGYCERLGIKFYPTAEEMVSHHLPVPLDELGVDLAKVSQDIDMERIIFKMQEQAFYTAQDLNGFKPGGLGFGRSDNMYYQWTKAAIGSTMKDMHIVKS